MQDFTDRVVFVSGAAGILGNAVAAAFYEAGASLALCDRNPDTPGSSFDDAARVLVIESDLTDPASAEAAVARSVATFGHVDVLAAIAGGFAMGKPVHELPYEAWEYMMRLNAGTLFNSCHAVVPHMRRNGGGKIVTIAARAALSGKPGMAAYTASKAAVIRLTESLSEENKHYGINVNCVLPSIIDTPANRRDMPDADFGAWVSPRALADVIMFLASDASRAMYGASVAVSGLS
ncbi:MAG: SDR family NAD(P)-dependent oxidoreductase [Chlorobi bacterium]|nr:SDR family NAD(P)-dependent oxidoreductase [Chlorobiota bacterium]